MSHLHGQTDGLATVSGNTIEINFSNLPLNKLVALRRLREGLSAKTCESWQDASRSAVVALRDYLGQELEPNITVDGFFIKITVNGTGSGALQWIIDFFAREKVIVQRPSGIRGTATA